MSQPVKKEKDHRCKDDAVPAEEGKRVRLDVVQQPLYGDEGNRCGNNESEQDHAPVLGNRGGRRVVECPENLEPAGGEHCGNSDQK